MSDEFAITRRGALFGSFALALLLKTPRLLEARNASPEGYDAWAEFPSGLRLHVPPRVRENGDGSLTVIAEFPIESASGAIEFGIRVPGTSPRTEYSYRFDDPFYPIFGSSILAQFTYHPGDLAQIDLERCEFIERRLA